MWSTRGKGVGNRGANYGNTRNNIHNNNYNNNHNNNHNNHPNRGKYPHDTGHKNVEKSYQQKHIAIVVPKWGLNELVPYTNDNLIAIKTRLNEAKSKLDPLYARESNEWTQFQNTIDIYKPMRFEIAKGYNAKNVTNAWMKYWEIYNQYGLIGDGPVHAFFNAELPGAALCAFNHYMKTKRPGVVFDWRASSLVQNSDNNALGDTYGLYEMNKSKWVMSGTNNGDATVMDNILDFAAQIGPDSSFGGVDLYSHDAGIDVSDDFNEQETANAKIHLGCAIAGFMTLKPGGNFVAKQYTFFETLTWNLIIIYSQLFDEFYICKPLTSRPYNSEVYLVGKGFKGFDEKIKTILVDKLMNFNMNPVLGTVPIEIMSEIERAARIIFVQQYNFIEENIKLFSQYKLNNLRVGLEQLKHDRKTAWLKCYPVGSIKDFDQLPSK